MRRRPIRSWAETLFARHPDAVSLTIEAEAYDVPVIVEYRDCARPSWEPVYRTQIQSIMPSPSSKQFRDRFAGVEDRDGALLAVADGGVGIDADNAVDAGEQIALTFQRDAGDALPRDTPLFTIAAGLVRILDRDLQTAGIPSHSPTHSPTRTTADDSTTRHAETPRK